MAVPVRVFRAASAAAELFIFNVVVAHAHRGLEVPVAGQYPLIAVGDAATDETALVAAVPQFVEQTEGQLDTGHVELAAHGVDTEKVTVEPLTGPETVLGHQHPVARLLRLRKLPGVETVKQLHRTATGHAQLDTEIGCQGRIVQQVGLQSHLLGADGQKQAGQKQPEENAPLPCKCSYLQIAIIFHLL